MLVPGHPESEKERLASWLRLPRRARAAIRRLHRNLRHLPKEALVQMSCLLELHKTVSMPQRLFDAKDATTQSRDLKHTTYRHLDLVR